VGGIEINVIEYLRANLRDRYKDCYAVLKELIQNADDAGATQLHIAAVDGIDGSSHPLLKGPLLLLVNNAPFTFRDSCSIHHAGMGSKGLEENKIGKFGLGLKSVFHLCEAFFYLSDPTGDEGQADDRFKKYGRTGILNPWKGEERYSSWDSFSNEDQGRVEELVQSVLSSEATDWFAICLPLRTRQHCVEIATDDPARWAIDPRYYGEEPQPPSDIFSQAHFVSICELLPMMSTLRSVRFWQFKPGQMRTATLTAEIVRHETAHVNWRTMGVGREVMAGRVGLQCDGMTQTWNYVGVQQLLDRQDLTEVSRRSDWPWMDAQTKSGHERSRANVKQHAAVILLETAGGGTLEIERAVFLPLGDPSHRSEQGRGAFDYKLLLHGCFFVDAGRLWVDFASKQEEETARQAWNRILYREGTLPLVIPTLGEFARVLEEEGQGHERLLRLTALLNQHQLWNENCTEICRDGSWGFRLLAAGSRWCQTDLQVPLVVLAGGEELAFELPFTVFPALEHIAPTLMLAFKDLPRLSVAEVCGWQHEAVREMFDSVPVAEVAKSDDQLQYLVDVCRDLCIRQAVGIHSNLRSLLRRLLSELSATELRRRKETLAGLVRLLPPFMSVRVPFKSDLVRESDRLFEVLIRLPTEVLPLPDYLCDHGVVRSCATTTQDIRTMMMAICDLRPLGAQEDLFHSLLGQAIAAIMSTWKQEGQPFSDAFGDLRLFYAKNFRDDCRRAYSARELKDFKEIRLVFVRNPAFCKRLQDCLAADSVLFVADTELSGLLIQAIGPLPDCEKSGCIALLDLRPELNSDVSARQRLLESLLPALDDAAIPQARNVLRYLLHANAEVESQDASLFIDGDNAWCEAARWGLASIGQSWRMISCALTDLKRSDAEKLRLHPCDRTTVPGVFRTARLGSLDHQTFSDKPDWRNQLLQEWPEVDLELLKRLPLFVRAAGGLTSITDQTFIQGGELQPPASIFRHLVLICDDSGIIQARGIAQPLSIENVLNRLLLRDDCCDHWLYILESIPKSASSELERELRAAAWIPRAEGNGIAPRGIVCREGLAEYVRNIRRSDRALVHKADLPEHVLNHPRWAIVETLAPQGIDLLKLLGEVLVGSVHFAIGVNTFELDNLSLFISLFDDPEGAAAMPAVDLLRLLTDGTDEMLQAVSRHTLPALRTSLDPQRSRGVLQYLASRHERTAGRERRWILETFNRFLKEALTLTAFVTELKRLRFLNQEERWCSPETLSAVGANISPSNLIHGSHLKEFDAAGFRNSSGGQPESGEPESAMDGARFDPESLAASAALLGDYLETWRCDEVPDDALAAVVAMLGNGEGFPQLYERLRDARSLEAMRKSFVWDTAGPDGLQHLMDDCDFCILPADPKVVRARNLFGMEFGAAVDLKVTSLFDGFGGKTYNRYFQRPNGGRCFQMWLRKVSPDNLLREDKLEILGNTIQAVRRGIYRVEDDDFAETWRHITQVGQLDIEVAQEMILESSAILLESQLSVRQSEKLKAIFGKWHRVRQRSTSASQAQNDNERKAAEEEKGQVLEELRSLLVNDRSTQQLLLSEIRKKLDDNSYGAASIPFELFQNADDSVVELESLCVDAEALDRIRPANFRQRFLVDINQTDGHPVLRFAHWGRGINQYRLGSVDRRDLGFDRDMERMLVLQGSGKAAETTVSHRTGKFGLGFKSVFFACDEPRVLSASRSRFRVIGGVYPDRLSREEERCLERILESAGDKAHRGTVVELRMRDPDSAEHSLTTFKKLAGYLVVFAHRIRECTIEYEDRVSLKFDWRPNEILPGIESGSVRTQSGKTAQAIVLRLDSDGYGAVLVPIGPNGVDTTANTSIPKIWVTTPTEHGCPGALIVNGLFDVNPGRTQLRDTERNRQTARKMGEDLGGLLCSLHEHSRSDWQGLRQALGCLNASCDEFWASLWNACLPYADQNSTHPVLWQVLFGSEHCGMYRLVRSADVLPTGLPGNYSCLTSLKAIRWRTQGALTESEVWASAIESNWVRINVLPGTVVSNAIGQSLVRICQLPAQPLTLAMILKESLNESLFVTSDQANSLGRMIFPDRFREISNDRATATEGEEIREVLSLVRFQTAAGTWADSNHLLIGHDAPNGQEELRRAAFAPAENLLAEHYQDHGLQFFLVCRKEMQASVEQMCQWILNADDDSKRRAALEYLERGGLSYPLRQRLTENESALNASWLGDRRDRERVLNGMDPDRQAVILGMLRKSREISPVSLAPTVDATRPASDIFRDILTWWRKHRTAIIDCHDQAIYPARRLPQLSFTATLQQLESDIAVRKEWLTVFMLGSTGRIGRTTRHQNRGFLKLCDERGWLDVLADRADDPASWFKVMDDYLDSLQGESPYFNWMNQFLGYYQLSRWLPQYARAFEAVTRPNARLDDLRSIHDIDDLRTSHVFSRSTGFDAPPCSRTMGLGSHFVLREVIRARVRQSDQRFKVHQKLARMAYVPSGPVRRLLTQITHQTELLSSEMPRHQVAGRIADILHEHLGEDALFEENFDIPLLVLTWNRFADERRKLLGIDDGPVEQDPVSFLDDDSGTEESNA
jgi:hypothetical protein